MCLSCTPALGTFLNIVITLYLYTYTTHSLRVTIPTNGQQYVLVLGASSWDHGLVSCQSLVPPHTLAVFESTTEYTSFIAALVQATAGTYYDGQYYIGVKKPYGDPYMRTAAGGRVIPFSNFYNVSADIHDELCVFMDFKRSPSPHEEKFLQLANSPWGVGRCSLPRQGYICMAGSGYKMSSPPRVLSKCYWSRYRDDPLTWVSAYTMCAADHGTLLNLNHPQDILITDSLGLIDHRPPWKRYWLGLLQKPGEGAPHWSNNGHIANNKPGSWESRVNYGSSLYAGYYVGLYRTDTRLYNVWAVLPSPVTAGTSAFTVGQQQGAQKAFAICEAAQEDFCLTYTPTLQHADKTTPCCNDVRYTCKPGYVFPDSDVEKRFPCSCNAAELQSLHVEECVVWNPCRHHEVCGPYGRCLFTNQVQAPYYCQCQPGYTPDLHGTCTDIDECTSGGLPCGPHPGDCININGSYFCTCRGAHRGSYYPGHPCYILDTDTPGGSHRGGYLPLGSPLVSTLGLLTLCVPLMVTVMCVAACAWWCFGYIPQREEHGRRIPRNTLQELSQYI